MKGVRKLALIFNSVAAISTLLATTANVSFASPIKEANFNILVAQDTTQGTKTGQAQTIEENNLKFQLQNCQRKKIQVICSLLITNLGEDEKISMFTNPSSSFDYSGGEYKAKTLQLAEKEKSTHQAIVRLLNGITARVNVGFEIPADVNKLSGLEIGYRTTRTWNTKIMFQEIDIDRPQ
jgi:hypothetical protein